jgi:transposase
MPRQSDSRVVQRRRRRRHLANFENLPVTTRVYDLSAEQRACPGCGVERKEAGAEESWQIEYLPGRFERIHHVRKKYACAGCESSGEHPQMETASKPESAIDKGLAGPGLLSCIVTSKFSDYLPLYRLEDIFARQGFEISRATQSVWCGDVADLVEPLYELMAERVRASHVVATDDTIMPMLNTGKTANARMWVYVGGEAHPYNVFDSPSTADATDRSIFSKTTIRFCWRMLMGLQRRGGRQWHRARGMLGSSASPDHRGGEGRSRDRA